MLKILRRAALASVMTFVFPGFALADGLKVVASFSIIGDFARNVGGDRVTITTLVGPGGDAHVYEPKPADAAAVSAADVVLVNGLQFEGFLQRLVEASGTKAPVVELTKGAEVLEVSAEEHGHAEGGEHAGEEGDSHGAFDPHAWQSVHNATVYVKNIAEAFCTADAAGCATYEANAAAYGEKLEALDAGIRSAVDGIPAEKRTIITSHDAFGYFEHEYGIRFLAPKGVSTESEASAADVAALIRQIREDRASAIFVESITNPRLVEQIASETGLQVGGALYSDALSAADGPAATYVDMMRHNIATIRGAILGS
ncbi:MAG: metal ABC transporter substrate-binding protein [Rhizobiaceae bacterium]|nr:MAG: metal ABC transporter substrate-binding protein [Rhizobiaceae bacterium]CAG1014116.1 putative periplasmic iron-binding protein [Rhizobiaceae bacterium]